MTNVSELDDFRDLEEIVKRRLGCDNIVLAGVRDNAMVTFYSEDLKDIELVYIIQTLKDRRHNKH